MCLQPSKNQDCEHVSNEITTCTFCSVTPLKLTQKASPKQHWKTMLLKATQCVKIIPFWTPLGAPWGDKFEQEAPKL